MYVGIVRALQAMSPRAPDREEYRGMACAATGTKLYTGRDRERSFRRFRGLSSANCEAIDYGPSAVIYEVQMALADG